MPGPGREEDLGLQHREGGELTPTHAASLDFGRLPQDGGLRLCRQSRGDGRPSCEGGGVPAPVHGEQPLICLIQSPQWPSEVHVITVILQIEFKTYCPSNATLSSNSVSLAQIISICCLRIWAGRPSGSADLGWTSPVSGLGWGRSV